MQSPLGGQLSRQHAVAPVPDPEPPAGAGREHQRGHPLVNGSNGSAPLSASTFMISTSANFAAKANGVAREGSAEHQFCPFRTTRVALVT